MIYKIKRLFMMWIYIIHIMCHVVYQLLSETELIDYNWWYRNICDLNQYHLFLNNYNFLIIGVTIAIICYNKKM